MKAGANRVGFHDRYVYVRVTEDEVKELQEALKADSMEPFRRLGKAFHDELLALASFYPSLPPDDFKWSANERK